MSGCSRITLASSGLIVSLRIICLKGLLLRAGGLRRALLRFSRAVPASLLALLAPARATSDIRALFRSELTALDGSIKAALPRAANRETRAHLEDARDQIDKILHPRS